MNIDDLYTMFNNTPDGRTMNDIAAFADVTHNGETIRVTMPLGVVTMLCHDIDCNITAVTWLFSDPDTCPRNPNVALAALEATRKLLMKDRPNLNLSEQEAPSLIKVQEILRTVDQMQEGFTLN